MARPPKPWYWKTRKGWYAYIGGKKTPLGTTRDEAFTRFHEIMAKPSAERHPIHRGDDSSGRRIRPGLERSMAYVLANCFPHRRLTPPRTLGTPSGKSYWN